MAENSLLERRLAGKSVEEQMQEMQTNEKVRYDTLLIAKGAKIGNDKKWGRV